jgi:hypothetical protein
MMPILMRILPQVFYMLENLIFFTFSHRVATVYKVLSFSSVSTVSKFSIFWTACKNFLEKSLVYNLFHLQYMELIPIRIMAWMPIPIRIRENEANPTRSGSTTLVSLRPDSGSYQVQKKFRIQIHNTVLEWTGVNDK